MRYWHYKRVIPIVWAGVKSFAASLYLELFIKHQKDPFGITSMDSYEEREITYKSLHNKLIEQANLIIQLTKKFAWTRLGHAIKYVDEPSL